MCVCVCVCARGGGGYNNIEPCWSICPIANCYAWLCCSVQINLLLKSASLYIITSTDTQCGVRVTDVFTDINPTEKIHSGELTTHFGSFFSWLLWAIEHRHLWFGEKRTQVYRRLHLKVSESPPNILSCHSKILWINYEITSNRNRWGGKCERKWKRKGDGKKNDGQPRETMMRKDKRKVEIRGGVKDKARKMKDWEVGKKAFFKNWNKMLYVYLLCYHCWYFWGQTLIICPLVFLSWYYHDKSFPTKQTYFQGEVNLSQITTLFFFFLLTDCPVLHCDLLLSRGLWMGPTVECETSVANYSSGSLWWRC